MVTLPVEEKNERKKAHNADLYRGRTKILRRNVG